jgi:psiF repeat
MISRWAALFIALTVSSVRADTLPRPVTATPPLQVVPATPVSRNVQQRMRGCNTSADARKLRAAARETFIRSCMAPHRGHALSRPGSQPKTNP